MSSTNTNSQIISPADLSWTELSPTNIPPGRDSHVIAYNPLVDKVVMFGGWSDTSNVTYVDDTWIFDRTTNNWTNVTSLVNPGVRGYIQGVFDPTTNEVIFFGGFNETMAFGDTWGFNYNGFSWRNISTPVAPTPRGYYGAGFSTQNNTLVMFGGQNDFTGVIYNETWSYTSSDGWVNQTTSDVPEERTASHLVYDEMHDKFILFGGYNSTTTLNDTWAYDLNSNTWTQMFPANAPTPTADHTMFYDRYHGQSVLFGGSNDSATLNETWVYDYSFNSWTFVNSTVLPEERSYLRSTYISSTNEHLMFGGYSDDGNSLNDTWILDWAGGTPPVTTNPTSSSTSTSSDTTTPTDPNSFSPSTTTSTTTTTSATDPNSGSSTSSATTTNPLPILNLSIIFSGLGIIVLMKKYKK